jgi:quercetin dioxygenase-like cupin family protein
MLALTTGNELKVLVAGEHTQGRFAVIEARERRGAAPPRHVHSREDEFIYVLEGQLTLYCDGQRFDRPSGTSLLLPRGSEHTFTVESAEARLLMVLSPAGLESCLRDVCRQVRDGGCQQLVELVVASAARHGVSITGPGRPP